MLVVLAILQRSSIPEIDKECELIEQTFGFSEGIYEEEYQY
jgi:hypothetical protein